MLATEAPFPQYFDTDGSPLDAGYLYYGVANQNPETNPITVYWDAAGTQPAAQPIRTINGFAARSGSAAVVYVPGDYSLTVRDRVGRLLPSNASSASTANSASILAQITAYIASVATTAGASLMGFIQSIAGAIGTTVQSKLRESVSVFDFMTPAQIADVRAGTLLVDVTAAVQSAINAITGQPALGVGQAGGRLFFPPGKYLITSTLYVGYGLCMEGVWAGGYPYVSATTQTSELYFNFGATTSQWAIDSQTFHSAAGGGGRILYNEWVTDQIAGSGVNGYTATYGLSIKGLLLVDANNALQTQVIYGALRLNGCPNARLENISYLGFGYGLVLGGSYGTTVRNVTGSSNYYGCVAYNANNGISFHGCQFDKIVSPASIAVPGSAIPSWMPSSANFNSVYNLDGSHNGSAKGLIIAAAPAIGSNGATIDVIAQYWPDTWFLNNSYSNTFVNGYAELCQGYVLTTAYASFNFQNGHNFSSASPLYFADFGYNSIGKVNMGGNNTFTAFWKNAWASASSADATRVSVVNVSGTGGNLPANQRVTMEYETGTWTPVVTSSGGALTSVTGATGQYTKIRDMVRVEYQFTIANAGTGSGNLVIAGLPYQARTQQFQLVLTNANKTGQLVTAAGSTQMSLFNSDGTFPGATGVTYFAILTYLV